MPGRGKSLTRPGEGRPMKSRSPEEAPFGAKMIGKLPERLRADDPSTLRQTRRLYKLPPLGRADVLNGGEGCARNPSHADSLRFPACSTSR
jgi:hypothetical protein